MIYYHRSGGFKPPQDNELLEINSDGTFSMWRSVGWATYPPSPIGQFGGQLDSNKTVQLQPLVEAAAGSGNLEMMISPDSPIETIELTGVHATLGIHDDAPGPWGALIEQVRPMLGELTAFPQAAIGVEVLPGGQSARLIHLGQEPVQLGLGNLTVRAVLWEGYTKKDDWWASKGNIIPTEMTARPGWQLDLPFDHGFKVTKGLEVIAYINFELFQEEQPIPVSLESRRLQT